jgi:hypothetical protein
MFSLIFCIGVGTLAAIAVLVVAVALSVITSSTKGVTPHGKVDLKSIRSISDLIAASKGGAVHIMFVHGIRATGPGASTIFQGEMQKLVAGCKLREHAPRQYLDLTGPPPASFAGAPVWDPCGWERSRPFVDRSVYDAGGTDIVVDEVNWWPLAFPLKCEILLMPEISLSGADTQNLDFCAKTQADQTTPNTYWPWTSKEKIAAAIKSRPRKSGGAPINNILKQQIMNWGLADAVIALGPMRSCFREMMEKAFAYASSGERPMTDRAFVVVSESLGSFIVMDVFSAPQGEAETAKKVLADHTYDLYFFANQFRLLSLARLWEAAPPSPAAMPTQPQKLNGSYLHPRQAAASPLETWARGPAAGETKSSPALKSLLGRSSSERQIIAFNDPSDALTYEVPDMANANVVNFYDRNSTAWLWLFENPVLAHTGHSQNKAVLKMLFK